MPEPNLEAMRQRYLPRLREELDTLRRASEATAAQRRPVALDQQSVGRLSRMDAIRQQAMAAAQEVRRDARIRALEATIRRIETVDFGWCDACGDFIGERRLDLDPAIMRCRDCAR